MRWQAEQRSGRRCVAPALCRSAWD
jgi:hypothetical protein